MGAVGGVDRTQRRFTVLGFPLAVIYKFFDDQGNYLAAAISYYAFVAIFPLLLLASSIFGFILQGNPELQHQVLDSALAQFPIVGQELGRPQGLRGSTGAVVGGALAATYGALGLGQAIQNLMATAWAIPRNSRPNPVLLRAKSLLLLLFAGIAVLAVSVVSALGSNTEVFGSRANIDDQAADPARHGPGRRAGPDRADALRLGPQPPDHPRRARARSPSPSCGSCCSTSARSTSPRSSTAPSRSTRPSPSSSG